MVNDERIAATDPGNRTFLRALSRDLWCLAVTLQAQGDFAGAETTLRDALEMAPSDPRLKGSLEQVLKKRVPSEIHGRP